MIFVYPAIVSENVDPKIGPAVCKTLEQYFLLHLAESFSSGNLRVKTIFDFNGKGKGTYGPLMLENKKIAGKLLMENDDIYSKDSRENDGSPLSVKIFDTFKSKLNVLTKSIEEFINIVDKLSDEFSLSVMEKKTDDELLNIKTKLLTYSDKVDQYKSELNQMGDGVRDLIEKMSSENSLAGEFILQEISKIDAKLSKARNDIVQVMKLVDRYITSSEKKEEKGIEKQKKDLAQYETHGNYKVETMKGVSFKPSMMNLNVKIHYIGGPHEDAKINTSPSETFQEISIGCKIQPLVLKNFGTIEDAILDDYFSTSFQSWWKSTYRTAIRSSIGYVEKAIKKLTGASVDTTSKMGAVNKEILMAPQGFINASSFKAKSGTPGFYHYSSAMVILNKDDLVKEESANFFLNKSQLTKMFKMGWNAFCILDPTKEEATFITSMDGGALHVLPYSFVFHTLGMEQIYSNMSDLQRRSPIFRKSFGNLNTLVSKLKRESTLLKMTRKLLKS